MDQEQTGFIPCRSYDDMSDEFKARGIDLYDVMNSKGHFDRWVRRNGLPSHDEEGKHKNSSHIYMRMYRQDPRGEAERPPYVDVWHFLLNAYKMISWQEENGRRVKRVPLIQGAYSVPPELTPESLAEGRRRIEADVGKPMDDDMWNEVSKDFIHAPIRAEKSIEILEQIVDAHGVEVDVEGEARKVMLLEMRV